MLSFTLIWPVVVIDVSFIFAALIAAVSCVVCFFHILIQMMCQ